MRNKLLRNNTEETWISYKKQRNICVNLIRNQKNRFHSNLDIKIITDNKRFGTQVKPFFSDKNISKNSIMLKENNKIIAGSTKCAEIMNNFFSDAVGNLDIDIHK